MKDGPLPFLDEDWLELQQRYWKTWSELDALNPDGAANPGGGETWEKALDNWWQAVSPAIPVTIQDFFGHLVQQGKGYFTLTRNLAVMLNEISENADSPEDWRRLLSESMEDMKTAVGALRPDGRETLGRMLSFWELPMDNWLRTASVMSGLPGDVLQPFKSHTLHQQTEPMRAHLEQFLSVPGVGYSREHQEQHRKYFRLLLDYQAASEAYGAEYAKIGAASVELFKGRLTRVMERGETVDRLQVLYDLWVDACEEAYADRVFSDDYARVHGNLINKLMALKKQGQALVDEALGTYNIPTRAEVTTMQAGFQALRRELRAVKSQLAGAGRKAKRPGAGHRTEKKAAAAPRVRKKAVKKAGVRVVKKAVVKRTVRSAGTGRKGQREP